MFCFVLFCCLFLFSNSLFFSCPYLAIASWELCVFSIRFLSPLCPRHRRPEGDRTGGLKTCRSRLEGEAAAETWKRAAKDVLERKTSHSAGVGFLLTDLLMGTSGEFITRLRFLRRRSFFTSGNLPPPPPPPLDAAEPAVCIRQVDVKCLRQRVPPVSGRDCVLSLTDADTVCLTSSAPPPPPRPCRFQSARHTHAHTPIRHSPAMGAFILHLPGPCFSTKQAGRGAAADGGPNKGN